MSNEPDNSPALFRPFLYFYLRLMQVAAFLKGKAIQFIDWILGKIVTWLIIWYWDQPQARA